MGKRPIPVVPVWFSNRAIDTPWAFESISILRTMTTSYCWGTQTRACTGPESSGACPCSRRVGPRVLDLDFEGSNSETGSLFPFNSRTIVQFGLVRCLVQHVPSSAFPGQEVDLPLGEEVVLIVVA